MEPRNPVSNDQLISQVDHSSLMVVIDLLSHYVQNNEVPADSMGSLIRGVHSVVSDMSASSAQIGLQFDELGLVDLSGGFSPTLVTEDTDIVSRVFSSLDAGKPDSEGEVAEDGYFVSSLASLEGITPPKAPETTAVRYQQKLPSVETKAKQQPGKVAKAPKPKPKPKPVQEPKLPRGLKSISDSVRTKHIVCLEDGKKVKDLAEHLATLGMSPADYRLKWELSESYPMMAPDLILKKGQVYKIDPFTNAKIPVRG